MDSINLASGDNHSQKSKKSPTGTSPRNLSDEAKVSTDITPKTIEENEKQLKDRISQCKDLIDSLKLELNKEKSRFDRETNENQPADPEPIPLTSSDSNYFADDMTLSTNIYSDTVENKLNCDENILEYEKQLQKYQNTLNMAQLEKKNAIRKQMMAKAYRLKLLEVENQCNIELLRVKQSLQCLEPLKMIANKWKTAVEDNPLDYSTFELMPRFPDVNELMTICANESPTRVKDEDVILDGCDRVKDDTSSVDS